MIDVIWDFQWQSFGIRGFLFCNISDTIDMYQYPQQ
jgi:hypothetical protein